MNLKKRVLLITLFILEFVAISILLVNGQLAGFDEFVYTQVSTLFNPVMSFFMLAFTYLGSASGVIAIALLLLVLKKPRFRYGLPISIALACSHLFNIALKLTFARERPSVLRLVAANGLSFPSGHAMNNATIYFLFLFISSRIVNSPKHRLVIIISTVLFPFIIGISRVYCGVHYGSDVIAGWSLGIALALIFDMLLYSFARKRQRLNN